MDASRAGGFANCAKDSRMLRVRRPIDVVVLNCCITETRKHRARRGSRRFWQNRRASGSAGRSCRPTTMSTRLAVISASSCCKAHPSSRRRPAVVISTGQAHPSFAPLTVDEGLTGFALRLAANLNSSSNPPRTIYRCRSHSEPFRYGECRCWSTSSLVGLGEWQHACSLGQAKEAWARPMRSGDPLGNHGQGAIMPAFIFEPVLTDEDGVSVSAPLAH
jgi:hypothetical protein